MGADQVDFEGHDTESQFHSESHGKVFRSLKQRTDVDHSGYIWKTNYERAGEEAERLARM